MKKSLLIALLTATALVPVGAAEPSPTKPTAKPAPRPKAERSFGGAGKGPLLTRTELRSCLAQQETVRADTETLAQERALRDAEKRELQASGEALKAELAVLDRGDAEAVDRYNAKAQSRDQAVDAFQAATAAFNEKVRALESQRQAFTQACGNRRYDEDDELAIRSGR